MHPALIFLLSSGLPPVAFDQDPAVTAVLPVMRDPDRVAMRGTNPVAVDPDITVAIPAVIAVDPHPTFMRRTVVFFDDGRGRRDTNDNLSQRDAWHETDSKQQ